MGKHAKLMSISIPCSWMIMNGSSMFLFFVGYRAWSNCGAFSHRIKASGEQYDDRVVEVCWDPQRACWRKMRFRDDKPEGNHRSVVDKIVQSILDGIEQDEV